MKNILTYLLRIILIVFGVFTLLTLVGVVFNLDTFISIIGMVLYFITMIGFLLVDKISKLLNSIYELFSAIIQLFFKKEEESKFLLSIKLINEFVTILFNRFGLIVRALSLSVSFWIIDFYSYLINFDYHNLAVDIKFNCILTLSGLIFSSVDSINKKSISNPGLLSSIMSIFGFYSFFMNFFKLSLMSNALPTIYGILSNPFWFLNRNEYICDPEELLAIIVICIITLLMFNDSRKSQDKDAKLFSKALLFCGLNLTIFSSVNVVEIMLIIFR